MGVRLDGIDAKSAATTIPLKDSTAGTVGVTLRYARGDHAHPTIIAAGDGSSLSLTKDNNGYERQVYFDKAQNDYTGAYNITGTVTWAAGAYTLDSGEAMTKTLWTQSTTGKWETVISFETAWAAAQDINLYPGSNTYLHIQRSNAPAGNEIYVGLTVNGVMLIADTDTTVTLADSTYGRASVTYDGTNWQMYWADVAVGAATAGSAPTTPSIGLEVAGSQVKCIDLTYVPSVAHTDPFTSDTETRYMQLSSTDLTTWAASAAGDVVIDTGNTKVTLASADDKGVCIVGRSYAYGSGEFEFALDNNNDGGGDADTCCGVFCYQDISNYYKVCLEDDAAGAENLKFYKVVAGSATQLGTTKDVSATYTRSNKTWVKIQYSRETGQMWAYLRDNAGVYGTAPDINDAFSAAFSYGKFGYLTTVTTVGAGNLNVDFFPMTIRANLLIGETNVPATETGFYLIDEFTVDSIGRMTTTGTWTGTGGVLSCTAAGNCTLPFQTTIGVHTFTPTLANGTDYYYFGGYRIKFVASGGNQCLVTLETTAGVAQGTGSLTITTTAGLFGAPIVITETASVITVTVAGSGGTPIVSGTTTSTNAYPKFTVGTATCTFDVYSFAGTRYYMKPMLRGAQIGEYWNGTASVACTRLCDDFNWDTSAEYSGDIGSFTWDTANGYLLCGTGQKTITNNTGVFSDLVYEVIFSFPSVAAQIFLPVFRAQTHITGDAYSSADCYTVYCRPDNGYFLLVRGGNTLVGGSYSFSANVIYKLRIVAIGAAISATIYPVNQDYSTGATINCTDSNLTSGYVGFEEYTTPGTKIYSISINALESTSTNGVAITIGGVPHGARYDTQEEAYATITNTVKYGELKLSTVAKTTDFGNDNCELYYKNITDNTNIGVADVTDIALTNALWTDLAVALTLKYQDRADTLKVSARRKTFAVADDGNPVVFIDYLYVTPVWMI